MRRYRDLEEKNARLSEELKATRDSITQQLFQFQSGLSRDLKGDFNALNDTTVQRLLMIEQQVHRSLFQGFDSTGKAFEKLMEQIGHLNANQKSLERLQSQISGLQNILNDKKQRGTFGEVQLYTLLENVFGVNERRYQKQLKLSNGMIADCVLFAPPPLGNIVIDSKFPLENYNRMVDSQRSSAEQLRAKSDFRRDVAKHIRDISRKYRIDQETADFAYMFIPAESIFAEIVGEFDELMQLAYAEHVFVVSPTTLMAYLTAIQALYLDQRRNEKVEQIQREYAKLSQEFSRFKERWTQIEKDFERTWRDLQQVSVTAGKIVTRFEQIEKVHLEENRATVEKQNEVHANTAEKLENEKETFE